MKPFLPGLIVLGTFIGYFLLALLMWLVLYLWHYLEEPDAEPSDEDKETLGVGAWLWPIILFLMFRTLLQNIPRYCARRYWGAKQRYELHDVDKRHIVEHKLLYAREVKKLNTEFAEKGEQKIWIRA